MNFFLIYARLKRLGFKNMTGTTYLEGMTKG